MDCWPCLNWCMGQKGRQAALSLRCGVVQYGRQPAQRLAHLQHKVNGGVCRPLSAWEAAGGGHRETARLPVSCWMAVQPGQAGACVAQQWSRPAGLNSLSTWYGCISSEF